MNKREFSKVERPEATEDMFLLAERTENEKYLTTAKTIDVLGEKILLLNFFERSQLVKRKYGAAFRLFLTPSDYITQDLETPKTKWKTGRFSNLIEWCRWKPDRGDYDIVIASDQDYRTLLQYMKQYRKKEDRSVWSAIIRFQDEVMERRLKERHRKETDKIDNKMELVPEVLDGFDKWAHDSAMADKCYLVYDTRTRKKVITGYCTCCKKTVEVDTTVLKPRNKQRGICPACGSNVRFIPKGYFPTFQRDIKWSCLIQMIESGIVVRYFRLIQELQRDNNFKEEFSVFELCRVLYEEDGIELRKVSYEWDVYKQHGHCRWCPDRGKYSCGDAVLYTENLPESLESTTFRYCAADIYQKNKGCEEIPIYGYLASYPSQRYLEYFVKAGLFNMTKSIVNGYSYAINNGGKTPTEILDMPMDYIKTLAVIDGTNGEYCLLKQCAADAVPPNAKDIKQYYERFGGNDEMLGVVNIHMSIGKFIRYMDKQKKMLPKLQEQICHVGMMYGAHYTKAEKEQMKYKDLGKDWLDYISWCTDLKYNLNDMYVLLPPDFRKAHDRVMNEYQCRKDEIALQRLAEFEKQIKILLKEANGVPAMAMKTEKLMIVLPKSGEEIKIEGKVLHHCVGTYVESVAKGETMILFVRKTDKPEESYFTLEYRNGKVAQCRGKNNCSMPEDVKVFVDAFERKMSEAKKKKEAKKIRKVG